MTRNILSPAIIALLATSSCVNAISQDTKEWKAQINTLSEVGILNELAASRNYETNPFKGSLSECQAFASLFHNTCSSTSVAPAFADIPKEYVTC